MMRIYILRHAEAVDAEEAGGKDEVRQLTAKGEEASRHAGRGIKALGIDLDAIWTSPARRATQTAELAAGAMGYDDKVEQVEELAPGADPGEVAGLLQQDLSEGSSVMLVGHNPDLESLIQYLISGTDQAKVLLKKGGLALIEAERPLHQGCGALVGLVSPRLLAKLAESKA